MQEQPQPTPINKIRSTLEVPQDFDLFRNAIEAYYGPYDQNFDTIPPPETNIDERKDMQARFANLHFQIQIRQQDNRNNELTYSTLKKQCSQKQQSIKKIYENCQRLQQWRQEYLSGGLYQQGFIPPPSSFTENDRKDLANLQSCLTGNWKQANYLKAISQSSKKIKGQVQINLSRPSFQRKGHHKVEEKQIKDLYQFACKLNSVNIRENEEIAVKKSEKRHFDRIIQFVTPLVQQMKNNFDEDNHLESMQRLIDDIYRLRYYLAPKNI